MTNSRENALLYISNAVAERNNTAYKEATIERLCAIDNAICNAKAKRDKIVIGINSLVAQRNCALNTYADKRNIVINQDTGEEIAWDCAGKGDSDD